MPASNEQGLGLSYGWAFRESGWKDGMDTNLQVLGAVAGGGVKDRDLTAPPGAPFASDAYIVAGGATGAWGGHDGELAIWSESLQTPAWVFVAPVLGLVVHVQDEGLYVRWDGSAWRPWPVDPADDFEDDTAAAAGGVPIGGLYHDAGAVRVRVS